MFPRLTQHRPACRSNPAGRIYRAAALDSVLLPGQRSGFTLVEVLTVIAIILILVGLLFGGMRMWTASADQHLTETRLQVMNAMLADLEAAGHNQFSQQWFLAPAYPNPPTKPPFLWADAFGNVTAGADGTTYKMTVNGASPTSFTVACSRTNALLYMAFTPTAPAALPAYANLASTSASQPVFPGSLQPPSIMSQLVTLPNTGTALSGLGSSAAISGGAISGAAGQPPVVLDGWGNPILFVPAGGIFHVCTGVSTNPAGGFQAAGTAIIQSPDGRPFWVSAGPDGDFVKGDDNIYSFNLH